ncbi:dihydrolipoyllysine-residue succinyltransferase 1 [Phellopilus nigrolimitatus]|nr:dihydrolipoyllysine-residue succinyltransferase 1 [Phellopilus nigrolimitatus]
MLSKRVVAACARTHVLRSQFHSTHLLQEDVVKVPTMAESISEGTLKQWQKKVGDAVEADEEIATIETDKIDVSVNAPKAGKITALLAKEEETVSVGQDLFKYEPGAAGESSPSEPAEKPSEEKPSEEPKAEEKPKEEPKEQPAKKEPEPPAPKKSEKKPDQPAPPPPKPAPKAKNGDKACGCGPEGPWGARRDAREDVAHAATHRGAAEGVSRTRQASLTTFNEIDMSCADGTAFEQHEVKLGFMSAFARAACLALKEIPAANASIEGDEVVVAVATPKGLVTPVVRNAETMGFVDIEKEIAELGKKARDGKLSLEDMAGGSFTISNGGVFGSLYGTPIINLPQAAVLGMHTIKERPVVVNGEIVIRPIMVVALTYDHRLLDGRDAVTFLVKVRDYIEDPLKMLF